MERRLCGTEPVMYRSPLLILSLVVVGTLFTALIAPFFIDWSAYRDRLEQGLRQVTGQSVRIAGKIDVRLLPAPVLMLENVTLGRPRGRTAPKGDKKPAPAGLSARRLTASLDLAPLLRGQFHLTDFELLEPNIVAGVNDEGKFVTGGIAPLGKSKLAGLDSVKLDRVVIKNGTLTLKSAGGARTGLVLTRFDAELSAPFLTGPFKLNGRFRHGGVERALRVSTGRFKLDKNQHARMRIRLEVRPPDQSGKPAQETAAVFDGVLKVVDDTPGLSGRVIVGLPPPADDRNIPVKSQLRRISAVIAAGSDRLKAGNLVLAYRGGRVAPLKGHIAFDWRQELTLNVALKTHRLDLSGLSLATGRNAGPWGVVSGLLKQAIKAGVTGAVALDTPALLLPGRQIDNVGVTLRFGLDEILVERALATLPGRSRFTLTGRYQIDPAEEFTGDFALASLDARKLAVFVRQKTHRQALAAVPRALGNLTLKGALTVTGSRLDIAQATVRAGQMKGELDFDFKWAPRSTFQARLDVETIDLERDFPAFASQVRSGNGPDLAGVLTLLEPVSGGFEIAVGKLVSHGYSVRNAAASLDFGGTKMTVKSLAMQLEDGTRLSAKGDLQARDGQVIGAIDGSVAARDFARFLNAYGDLLPNWADWRQIAVRAAKAGPLDAKVKLSAKPGRRQGQMVFSADLKGNLAGSALSAKANYSAFVKNWQKGRLKLQTEIASKSSVTLLRQLGVSAQAAVKPARGLIRWSIAGPVQGKLNLAFGAELFGVEATARGGGQWRTDGLALEADLAVKTKDGRPLLAGFGVGFAGDPKQPLALRLTGVAAGKAGEYALSGFAGRLGRSRFELNGTANFTGARPALALAVDIDRVTVPAASLPAPAITAQAGKPKPVWSSDPVDFGLLARIDAKVTTNIRKLAFGTGLELDKVAAKIALKDQNLVIEDFTGGTLGGKFGFKGRIAGSAAGLGIDGAYEFADIRLEQVLVDKAGDVFARGGLTVTGTIKGTGVSVLGLISSLTGSGRIKVRDGVLRGFNPVTFNRALENMRNETELDGFIKGLLIDGEMQFSAISSDFSLSNGMVRMSDMVVNGEGAKGKVISFIDLATYRIDSEWRMTLAAHPKAPPVTLIFSGALNKPVRAYDARGLRQHLVLARLRNKLRDLENSNWNDAVRRAIDRKRQPKSKSPPAVDAPKPPPSPPSPLLPAKQGALKPAPVTAPKATPKGDLRKPALAATPQGSPKPQPRLPPVKITPPVDPPGAARRDLATSPEPPLNLNPSPAPDLRIAPAPEPAPQPKPKRRRPRQLRDFEGLND
jgi:uncharacterized protein involved in outer membrane biogenesis